MLALLLSLAVSAPAETPPDLVFILSDDHRSDFLGCGGHPFLQTPHIDALAERGVRFENAFVTTAICAASRATILTGLYERTHAYTFGEPPVKAAITEETYPLRLKGAGYQTGFVGKFGADFERTRTQGGPNAKELFDFARVLDRNPYFKPQPDGTVRHVTDLAGDACVEFIRGAEPGKPLHLSLSFNAAHAEDSDKERQFPYPFAEAGLYADAEVPEPLVPRDEWKSMPAFWHEAMVRTRYFWRWDTPEKYAMNYVNYCRLLTGMDRNVGRVVEALEVAGRLENSVIVFLGDNGYHMAFRGFAGKWSHHEQSLRVPLVMCDFRRPSGGRVSPALALNVDIAPTLLDYAGVEPPKRYQGVSLRPVIEGRAEDTGRDDFFIEHRMKRFDIPKYEGVRGRRFKYARYYENPEGGEYLHDLESDPLERTNLAGKPEHAETLKRLRTRTDELSARYLEARP